jgi:four helix bundle protein
MEKIRSFRDLRVWGKAQVLAQTIYQATGRFPKEELYGLTSQLRRAGISISTNIAEGSKRSTTKDLCHFLSIAQGSNEEVKSLLMLAKSLSYLDSSQFQSIHLQSQAIGVMLNGLIRSLRS